MRINLFAFTSSRASGVAIWMMKSKDELDGDFTDFVNYFYII